MNNKISNPVLKKLISEIANQANQGRVTNLNWQSLYESKNILKKEAEEKGKPDPSAKDKEKSSEKKPELPSVGGKDGDPSNALPPPEMGNDKGGEKDLDSPPSDPAPELGKDAPSEDPSAGEEDVEKAKTDAAEKQAELEKAKADKKKAEEELEKQSYIKFKSPGGQKYLLGKIVGQAFKSNTIDALAAEMAQKLEIKTPDDVATFEKDMALYKTIPGMVELISSIRDVAVEQPKKPSEEEQPQ